MCFAARRLALAPEFEERGPLNAGVKGVVVNPVTLEGWDGVGVPLYGNVDCGTGAPMGVFSNGKVGLVGSVDDMVLTPKVKPVFDAGVLICAEEAPNADGA